MRATSVGLAGSLVTLALTQRLDKPPLEGDLDYLQKGLLKNLHPVHSSFYEWAAEWIPADCKSITENSNLSASDVRAFNVTYDDCPNDPWILCRHNDSPDPLENMIDLFGRVPVRARQWVRHIINLPDPNTTWAYNSNGNIAMFDRIDGDLTVFIHETGHSLDLLGAYPDKPLSNSKTWLTNYAKDSHVPDPYSQTNQIEDLAQNTVVAAYNLNVAGGFGAVESNWREVYNQFRTIGDEQAKAGNMLVKGGICGKRLANSPVVNVKGDSRVMARGLGEPPDVGLSDSVDVIEPVEFDTSEACKRGSRF